MNLAVPNTQKQRTNDIYIRQVVPTRPIGAYSHPHTTETDVDSLLSNPHLHQSRGFLHVPLGCVHRVLRSPRRCPPLLSVGSRVRQNHQQT